MTLDEGNWLTGERFIKTLKAKFYKKMTVNDKKYYLPYLNKSLHECSDVYHLSMGERPINTEYSVLTENN